MSISPIEHSASFRIGSVEFVSPDEIKVVLDLDAPEGIAANTGIPREFPRINSYVLISSEAGFIVGQVEWIAIERSAFPKRKGFHDYGLVDLPFPLRKMRVNPLGVLKAKNSSYSFERGIHSFPSIGEPVLIPTDLQLRSIIESGQNRHVKIGTSPLAGNADVCIDPDRLFGRHLAVLGNTGSGKSCSVAGLIQWSLDAAQKINPKDKTNARFIILDPNGEYTKLFGDKARVFKVDSSTNPLQVPLWFWNSAEWCSFSEASSKVQRPILIRALREIRFGSENLKNVSVEEKKINFRKYLSSNRISIQRDMNSNAIKDDANKFGFKLKAIQNDLDRKKNDFPDLDLQQIYNSLEALLSKSYKTFTNKSHEQVEYYQAFEENDVESLINQIDDELNKLGGIIYNNGSDENSPIPFKGSEFADHLQVISQQENVAQYTDFLVSRIRTILADARMKKIIGDDVNIELFNWLEKYIGDNNEDTNCITVVDLSLVPIEITHIITAVISRLVFESLQRYRKVNGKSLPTVLVMEEAHTFIKRYKEDSENQSASAVCCQIFEKIAREGRKFGLGLLLSSQRPSELSPTVLSQCNSFLLHRISNDKDQDLVNRLMPDNFRGLLRELPTLPSQQAILLGWASELPVMVKMNDIPKEKQPQSADPDFWDVWTGTEERDVNWNVIADDWQQQSTEKDNDS
ncbi:Type IV secretory pathway%2C VirB4 components [Legionella pneumophila]|uniref:ATP-binding protein n=1 Tax=Legionella pneumophila TaxID=446 RepID=UPI0007709165|nr:Type IV secretory pathway%2C VirB4 components [Legionella pneumophila]CZH38880.1 Type IV secretory pathway%2C VirB4 components [Legionella pneumophila]